jgi:hypothetical protein
MARSKQTKRSKTSTPEIKRMIAERLVATQPRLKITEAKLVLEEERIAEKTVVACQERK